MIDPEGATETAEAGPNGPSSGEDKLLDRLTKWERSARRHSSKWREGMRLAYDFVAGHQWSSEDKTSLLEQMRQPVTFNRVAPMVDAVTGAEILNRQEVRYLPREQGDVQVNELITAADDWARELADTEDEESDAFADTVICGMGWSETVMDYDEDPEGRLIDNRIDPGEMWWDPQARKRCLADSRFRIRARWRDRDDLPDAWRKKLPTGTGRQGIDEDEIATGHTGPRDDYERHDGPAESGEGNTRAQRVWIRHFQWFDKETVYRLADPMTGKVATVTEPELRTMAEMFLRYGMRPPKAVKQQRNRYKYAIVCGDVILEQGDIDAQAFTFQCITGKRDRNSNTWYGVVRAMIDPQMWGNKFFVQIMHILNTAAKGGLLYETGAFTNPRKALEDWAKPDAAIELEVGALNGPAGSKVQERAAKNYPQGLDRLMEFALNNLPQTSGINMELLGLVERDQPGVLEAQRKKAGYAILAAFFDSLRRYRKSKGRVRLYFIQNYISDGRLIRIKGRDSTEQYVPLVRDKDTAIYDVIVDEAPMSPNQKEATWTMMQAMMPMLAKLNVPPEVWSVLIEYSPLPSSVSGKINQIIAKQAEQPPPPDPNMVKVQAQVELEKLKAQIQLQMQQGQAQIEAAQSQQEMQQKREEHELRLMELQAKVQATLVQAQAKIEAAQASLSIGAQKAEIDMTVAEHKAKQAMLSKPAAGKKERKAA